MYLFIDENTVEQYNGEVLKRYIDNRLVKAISNPTEAQLKEFGYKNLIDAPIPEYDENTQYIKTTYTDGESITAAHEVCNIEIVPDTTEETENENA